MSVFLEHNSSDTVLDIGDVLIQQYSVISIFLLPLSVVRLRVVNKTFLKSVEKWAEIEYKGKEEIHACARLHKRRGIQLGINWSRAMICQRQRDVVRTFNGEDNNGEYKYYRIRDKVSTFMTKLTGGNKFDDHYMENQYCFLSAIMKGRLCFDNKSAEEILSQVIIPANKLDDSCQECGETVRLFPEGFQARHYLLEGIEDLCCMRLNAICTNSPRFSLRKNCLQHCNMCAGRGTCTYADSYCHVCDRHTCIDSFDYNRSCTTCGHDDDRNGDKANVGLANRKKIMFLLKDISVDKPYIRIIVDKHRDLYEKIMLYHLKELVRTGTTFPDMDIYNTFDKFIEYLQTDMGLMIRTLNSQFTAIEGVIWKEQGGLDASMYDEEESLMDNLCRDGSKYVDEEENIRQSDSQEREDSDDDDDDDNDWVDCEDDEEDD